jgi:quercetin dioxygenase-like cupin family protein
VDEVRFAELGFFGPKRVLTRAECRGFLARLDRQPAPLDWSKGRAATSPLFHDLAGRRSILKPVIDVLGRNVILWGASIARREPGQVHAPHVDIEVADPAIRAVSVWIGLEGTTPESSLWLIRRSHRIGATIQEVAAGAGSRRGEYGPDEVRSWAFERDPECDLVPLKMSDGEALWFDGHLWHGSDNRSGDTRTALLLQYAASDSPIRIPNLAVLDYPFELVAEPRPPCIVMSGDGETDVNRLVPPPARSGSLPALSKWVRELELPLAQAPGERFTPHPIFRGATPNTRWLSVHASILESGHSPHPPHTHADEEILIVLAGHGELTRGEEVVHAKPGVVTYYPAGFPHTIRSSSTGSVQYLMIKWMGRRGAATDPLDAQLRDLDAIDVESGNGVAHTVLFEGATERARKVRCHMTTLEPGDGYTPHVDSHDVTIVLLEGTVETLGETVTGPAVVFSAGGWPHGIRNVGGTTARYLVVEIHGRGGGVPLRSRARGTRSRPASRRVGPPGRTQRARMMLWSAGGRVVAPFPRVKNTLRRLLRPLSPWR